MNARWFALALLLLGSAPLLPACSSSSSEGCVDIAQKICERLSDCAALTPTFSSDQQCLDSFYGYFEVAGSDDAACKDTWTEANGLDCGAFEDYFSL